MSVCFSCGAEIDWAITAEGRNMPVDPEPHPKGNLLRLANATGENAHVRVATPADPDGPRWISHFVSCPSAALHRRRR